MKLTPTQVAFNALKKAPKNRFCYLWVKPLINEPPFIEAFSLIQPLSNKDTWTCVGKIQNTGEPAVKEVAERITFVVDMYRSWNATSQP